MTAFRPSANIRTPSLTMVNLTISAMLLLAGVAVAMLGGGAERMVLFGVGSAIFAGHAAAAAIRSCLRTAPSPVHSGKPLAADQSQWSKPPRSLCGLRFDRSTAV